MLWYFNVTFNKAKQVTILNILNDLILGQILFKVSESTNRISDSKFVLNESPLQVIVSSVVIRNILVVWNLSL